MFDRLEAINWYVNDALNFRATQQILKVFELPDTYANIQRQTMDLIIPTADFLPDPSTPLLWTEN